MCMLMHMQFYTWCVKFTWFVYHPFFHRGHETSFGMKDVPWKHDLNPRGHLKWPSLSPLGMIVVVWFCFVLVCAKSMVMPQMMCCAHVRSIDELHLSLHFWSVMSPDGVDCCVVLTGSDRRARSSLKQPAHGNQVDTMDLPTLHQRHEVLLGEKIFDVGQR